MADQLEMELLKLADDDAQIFFKNQKPSTEQELFHPPEVLSLREVKHLQITIRSITFNSNQFQDKQISLTTHMPVIRNQQIEYQTYKTVDVRRDGRIFSFGAQLRSHFAITEQLLPAISQSVIKFILLSSDAEIASGSFALQTAILDGVRQFEYTTPLVQQTLNKKGQKREMEIASVLFEIQLQELKGGAPLLQPPREHDIEEQTAKIKEAILRQIQEEKERRQRQKQEEQELELQQVASQISTCQLCLQLSKVVFINRELCVSRLGEQNFNFILKMKSYGTPETNQTDTYWNVQQKQNLGYALTVGVSFETLQKMEQIPWIIELWGKSVTQNQDVLLGVSRLHLYTIHSAILSNNPLASLKFIKGNLYPQIIYDSEAPFEDLRTKALTVSIKLRLSFGTPAQISRIMQKQDLEEERDEPEVQPEEESEKPEQPESRSSFRPEEVPKSPLAETRRMPLQESLLTTLNQIKTTMRVLPREQYILKEEFIEIVKQLCGLHHDEQMIVSLATYLQFDELTMDWHLFLNSWKSFSNYKNQLKPAYTKTYSHFYDQMRKIFDSINQFERALPQGLLHLVDQDELRNSLLAFKGGNSPSGPSFSAITINQVVGMLELNNQNQVSVSQLVDFLRQFELYGEIRDLYAPIQQIASLVENNTSQWIQSNKELMEATIAAREFKQQLRPMDLLEVFKEMNLSVSLLDGVTILHLVGDYNNVELIDGQKVCTEIAFWQYLDWLSGAKVNPPDSPIKPVEPKDPGIKRPKPIDYQYCKSQIIVELLTLSAFGEPKFQIQVGLDETLLSTNTPQIYSRDQLVPINYRLVFTFGDKYKNQSLKQLLTEHIISSGLSINLIAQQVVCKGTLAIEEVLAIEDSEEFFIPLYDEIKFAEACILQCRIRIKQEVIEEQVEDSVQLYNIEGKLAQVEPISIQDIMEKLRPELVHTFRINVKSVKWFVKCQFDKFQLKVSLATEKKALKQAIPQFISDWMDNDCNILVEYQVKCDQILATQISKCHLLIEMVLQRDTQSKTLIGYLPIKPLFETKIIEGELPMDDAQTGAFNCTFNVYTTYTTDQIAADPPELADDDLRIRRKVVIQVLEILLFDCDLEGEIYLMLVNPINQSSSYEVDNRAILNTEDCIFSVADFELNNDSVELQIRQVSLGEDQFIGSVVIQLNSMHQEGIWSEKNYLTLETQLGLSARIGLKIIYICAPETANDNYLKAFSYPWIREIESAQNRNEYLRFKLGFSFSEIALLEQLLQDRAEEVFSSKILQFQPFQVDENTLVDLLKEFEFYDSKKRRSVDVRHLSKIFQYFQLPDPGTVFTPSVNKRQPIDFQMSPNHFDYLTYLAFLQRCAKKARQLFKLIQQGPIQHEIETAIRSKSPNKNPSPVKEIGRELTIEIISGHNLNQLTNRIPNVILSLPQIKMESKVHYSQSNPEFNIQVTLDFNRFENLLIEIIDKKYSPAGEKGIFNNQVIGQTTLILKELAKKPLPFRFQLPLSNGSKPAYLEIGVRLGGADGGRSSPVKTKGDTVETVRRLAEYFDQEKENDRDEDNKGQKGEGNPIRDLTEEIEDLLNELRKGKKKDEGAKAGGSENPQETIKQPKGGAGGRKPQGQFYSSSGSSSQPQVGGKSSDNKELDKIQEKLPLQDETLKRIEKILRQNNLPVEKVDDFSSDSDDYE